MVRPKRAKTRIPVIEYEDHSDDYSGFPFISFMEFRKEIKPVIVSNIAKKKVSVYDIDTLVDHRLLFKLADNWYMNHKDDYPFAIHVSKYGYASHFAPAYVDYPALGVPKIIGPHPSFEMNGIYKIRRRSCKMTRSKVANKAK